MNLDKAKIMFKNFRDNIVMSGIVVLGVGVALLIFTFISAYGFLTRSLSIIASEDLVQTFGGALAPLIEASIHIMYLGVMGWIGSLLTIRGVTIIAHAPHAVPEQPFTAAQKPVAQPQQPQQQPQQKPQPQKEKPKAEQPQQPPQPSQPQKEQKPPEPEIVVIPPEQVPQQQSQSSQQKQNGQKQSNA